LLEDMMRREANRAKKGCACENRRNGSNALLGLPKQRRGRRPLLSQSPQKKMKWARMRRRGK
jgi:hypothetical protein